MNEKDYLKEESTGYSEEEIEEMKRNGLIDENGYVLIDDSAPFQLPPDLKAMMDEYQKNGIGRLIELGLLDENGYFVECNDDRWKKLLDDEGGE